MKSFGERNLKAVAVVTAAVLVVAGLAAVYSSKLPFLAPSQHTYHAQLAAAGQLAPGEDVTVAGVKVGSVTGLHLEGDYVRLDFKVDHRVDLGDTTTLEVKVLSLLGQEYVQLTPHGSAPLHPGATIPLARTSGTQTLVDTVTNLGAETGQIDQAQLQKALQVADQAATASTPTQTAALIDGLGRLSAIVAGRQSQLAQLVGSAQQVAGTLSANDTQIVQLIGQSNLVLDVLNQRQAAIRQLLGATQALAHQVSAIITSKQADLGALLANLDSVSANLAKETSTIASALPLVSGFSKFAANAAGSGPYVDVIDPVILLSDGIAAACAKPGVYHPTTGCALP